MQGVPFAWLVGTSLVLALAVGCGSKDDDGLTYAHDIRPMFDDCVLCHSPGAPFGPGGGPDLVNPDSPLDGLLVALNNWKVPPYEDLPVPTRLVVPGQPDNSFLINKISDPALGLLPDDHAGEPMPYPIEPITLGELRTIEKWVSAGAQSDFFDSDVYPIFIGPNPGTPGKCDACHYKGTPNPPDMTDPYGPEGLVGVTSTFRNDLMRVAPGDPDASLLILRVRASAASEHPKSDIGAPMPKLVTPLTEAQVALVRQWIVEGARP